LQPPTTGQAVAGGIGIVDAIADAGGCCIGPFTGLNAGGKLLLYAATGD